MKLLKRLLLILLLLIVLIGFYVFWISSIWIVAPQQVLQSDIKTQKNIFDDYSVNEQNEILNEIVIMYDVGIENYDTNSRLFSVLDSNTREDCIIKAEVCYENKYVYSTEEKDLFCSGCDEIVEEYKLVRKYELWRYE